MTASVLCHGRVRWMIRGDVDRVLEIERESYEFPWDEETLLDNLRSRACIGMVIEHPRKDEICGFMVYELQMRCIKLLNIAVGKDYRRLGFGSAMIDKLKNKLNDQRRTALRVTCREANLKGQLFFRSCGMRATAIYENYYDLNDHAYGFVYRRSECHGA